MVIRLSHTHCSVSHMFVIRNLIFAYLGRLRLWCMDGWNSYTCMSCMRCYVMSREISLVNDLEKGSRRPFSSFRCSMVSDKKWNNKERTWNISGYNFLCWSQIQHQSHSVKLEINMNNSSPWKIWAVVWQDIGQGEYQEKHEARFVTFVGCQPGNEQWASCSSWSQRFGLPFALPYSLFKCNVSHMLPIKIVWLEHKANVTENFQLRHNESTLATFPCDIPWKAGPSHCMICNHFKGMWWLGPQDAEGQGSMSSQLLWWNILRGQIFVSPQISMIDGFMQT